MLNLVLNLPLHLIQYILHYQPSTTLLVSPLTTHHVTVTAETTEVLTLTSCVDNHCHKTTATTGVTVVTLTTSDIKQSLQPMPH